MGNMGQEYIDMLLKSSDGFGVDLNLWQFCGLLFNSIILGVILTALTYLLNAPLRSKENKKKKDIKKQIKIFLSATNILFLCVGLTGVMVLVNNNLARALAIGATLKLIRFRVNVGTKMIGSNMLFGIIAGIACGLNELFVAWSVTVVYAIIQLSTLALLKRYNIDLDEKISKDTPADKELDDHFILPQKQDEVGRESLLH